jgi:hypothetical protein
MVLIWLSGGHHVLAILYFVWSLQVMTWFAGQWYLPTVVLLNLWIWHIRAIDKNPRP